MNHRDEQPGGNGGFSGRKRALGLPGMRAVRMEVQQIIQNVYAGRAKAEKQESYSCRCKGESIKIVR